MLASLNIIDEPVGYSPPVGPAVRFTVRYNQREAFQPSIFSYANLGPKWTFDWLSWDITDNPRAGNFDDVGYYIMGGGTRTFTDFDGHSFALQQLDQTLLTRTTPDTYEMLSNDGTLRVFTQSDGASGTSRKVFLSKVVDPAATPLP